MSVAETEVELVKRDEKRQPPGHSLRAAETWRCLSGLSLTPRSGVRVGGEAESGREGPTGGEPLLAHPGPHPHPQSPVCPAGHRPHASPPTSDSSVGPAKADTDDSPPLSSTACWLCPLSASLPPCPPTLLSVTLSVSLYLWLSVSPFSPFSSSSFFLGSASSLPRHPCLLSLSFCHCLMTPFPRPFCRGLPSLSLLLSSPSCFPVPLPAVSLGPAPSPHLRLCPLFSGSQTLGRPEGMSRLEVHWWPLGAQNQRSPPPRKGMGRGSEVAACLARRKCLCCGLVTTPQTGPHDLPGCRRPQTRTE